MKRISKEELARRLACAVGLEDGKEGLGTMIYGWLARTRFLNVQAAVKARAKNLSTLTDDQAAFEEQKNTAGGKKTWKSYLWKVCGDEYDQAHGA